MRSDAAPTLRLPAGAHADQSVALWSQREGAWRPPLGWRARVGPDTDGSTCYDVTYCCQLMGSGERRTACRLAGRHPCRRAPLTGRAGEGRPIHGTSRRFAREGSIAKRGVSANPYAPYRPLSTVDRRQCAQRLPQSVRPHSGDASIDLVMGPLPDRNGARQQVLPFPRQRQNAAALVARVCHHLD